MLFLQTKIFNSYFCAKIYKKYLNLIIMKKFLKVGIAQANGRIGKILLFCLVGTLLIGSVNLILAQISSGQIQKAMLNLDYLSMIINTLIFGIITVVINIGCIMPIQWSLFVTFLDDKRNNTGFDIKNLFNGFSSGNYLRIVKTIIIYCLIFIGVAFLNFIPIIGSIAFIVLVIYLWLSFSMVGYVLKDDPAISGWAALKKSRAIMQGHKLALFIIFLALGIAIGAITSFILFSVTILITQSIVTVIAGTTTSIIIITLIAVPFIAKMGGVLADFYETAKNDYENKITA